MTARIARTNEGARRARRVILALAVLGATLTVTVAEAQTCSAVRASGGKSVKLAFARVQPDCALPDTSVLGGIPACTGDTPSASTWAMDPKTKMTFAAKSDKVGNVQMRVAASGIVDGAGMPVDGNGALRLTVRFVLEDPTGSPSTTQAIDLVTPVFVSKGKAKIDVTLNDMLTGSAYNALPPCFRTDLVAIGFEDPNGDPVGSVTSPLFSERSGTEYGSRG